MVHRHSEAVGNTEALALISNSVQLTRRPSDKTMRMNKYETQRATILARIEVKDYMWRYFHGMASRKAQQSTDRIDANTLIIRWPDSPDRMGLHDLRDISGELCWKNQRVQSVPSNLGRGRGVIYYFLCNGCDRKAKYLYFQNYLYAPLCRRCCGVPYPQSTRRDRRISRYLRRHPEVAQHIMDTYIGPSPRPP